MGRLDRFARPRRHRLALAAGMSNRAGTAWAQWQLEVQDPLNHPRKQLEVEAAARASVGAENGAAEAAVRVRYVIDVPADESD